MKILFVSPYLPSPPRFGGQRRIDGLMRGLARNHDVSVLAFNADDPYTQLSVTATAEFCREVITASGLDPRTVREKRSLQLRSLLSLSSFEHLQVQRRKDFQQQLDQQLAKQNYDVVQVEFVQLGAFTFPRTHNRPVIVLDEHNIEYDLQRRTVGAAEGLSRRVYNSLNWRKLRREEKAAWGRFDGVVLTSDRDRELLGQSTSRTPTTVVPNGVDVEQFTVSESAVEPDQMLFFGANNYFPNHDALLYFIDEILPEVLLRRPKAKLVIVGPGTHPAILARQSPNVEVVGFVDDLMPYLERCSVIVVPLRIGGGTRLKIVEAMAKGKAIVSTRIGAEGIDVTHEQHLLVGDTAKEFADQVVRVLAEPELARRLGLRARELAEKTYAWSAVVGRLERFYEELLGRRTNART